MLKIFFNFLFVLAIFFEIAGCRYDHKAEINTFQIPATEDIIMYEINIGAFSTTHNLQGITDRLDAVKALGINTIWLMPVYPVGIINSFGSPYCVRDYKNINTDYGTIEDLQHLVVEAHDRDIAVILDWVANHTAWDNAWINNEGWYTEDGAGNIISPPGTTWTDVADLNYDNADMRLAMIDAMQFWITTADIDGFRCDAADYVPFDFWQQAIDSLHNIRPDLILLAEGSRYDHFTAGFQMNFGWSFLTTMKNVFNGLTSANAIYASNTGEYSAVPDGGEKLRFITNHDETNIAVPSEVFGSNEAALAAAVITYCLNGVPLIYSGQEVGVTNNSVYSGFGFINWASNPDILFNYQQLLNFYSQSEVLKKGDLESFADVSFVVFKKTFQGERVVVIVNTKSTTQTLNVPAAIQGTWNNVFDQTIINLDATLELGADQFLILKN